MLLCFRYVQYPRPDLYRVYVCDRASSEFETTLVIL